MKDYQLLEVFLHEEHSRKEILQAFTVCGNLVEACIYGRQNHSATIDNPDYVDNLRGIRDEARQLPLIIQEKLPTYFEEIEEVIDTHEGYKKSLEGVTQMMNSLRQQ